MKLQSRALKELTPYDKNPRINNKAIDHVLESLKRHGQVKPIVLSEAGFPFIQEIICCGHTTAKALEKFGAKKVNVIVKQFESEAEFLDYNIRDNKVGEFAEWDSKLLASLGTEFDIDLADMGFNLKDIGQIEMVNEGDENDEWVGMPEFEAKDDSLRIIIHFEDEEKREEFAKKYPFEIMKRESKAWSTQYPCQGRDDLASVKFEDNGK